MILTWHFLDKVANIFVDDPYTIYFCDSKGGAHIWISAIHK